MRHKKWNCCDNRDWILLTLWNTDPLIFECLKSCDIIISRECNQLRIIILYTSQCEMHVKRLKWKYDGERMRNSIENEIECNDFHGNMNRFQFSSQRIHCMIDWSWHHLGQWFNKTIATMSSRWELWCLSTKKKMLANIRLTNNELNLMLCWHSNAKNCIWNRSNGMCFESNRMKYGGGRYWSGISPAYSLLFLK